eukprot:CAMPEP_0204569482 /NCGR_PEP_ID=MMETSP0661-20131031/37761_1 /ASSEMBLY_ACC=CAM_ASM_000606 /TAXON_ID=109239 /ORGANISM="Alexandrium margalefi, Strain AMGDE01CS-322" /LENGTH=230 /DNA_ID=CAMNT_0051577585 /DNA_START=62 /DNA_END=754 /DNA_ORIENTATION=-
MSRSALCVLLALFALAAAARRPATLRGLTSLAQRGREPGDEFEYGDREAQVSHGDASDFSVHQFLVDDDARDGASSTDGDAGLEAARSRAQAADDHFNSEDTPDSSDSFAQTNEKARKGASSLKASSASHASGRRQMPGDDDDENQDEFEHGDREEQVGHDDSSDFSVHQFLVDDDARNGDSSSGAAEDMARQKAEAADDHFNSEDTPDSSDSLAQLGKTGKTSRSTHAA